MDFEILDRQYNELYNNLKDASDRLTTIETTLELMLSDGPIGSDEFHGFLDTIDFIARTKGENSIGNMLDGYQNIFLYPLAANYTDISDQFGDLNYDYESLIDTSAKDEVIIGTNHLDSESLGLRNNFSDEAIQTALDKVRYLKEYYSHLNSFVATLHNAELNNMISAKEVNTLLSQNPQFSTEQRQAVKTYYLNQNKIAYLHNAFHFLSTIDSLYENEFSSVNALSESKREHFQQMKFLLERTYFSLVPESSFDLSNISQYVYQDYTDLVDGDQSEPDILVGNQVVYKAPTAYEKLGNTFAEIDAHLDALNAENNQIKNELGTNLLSQRNPVLFQVSANLLAFNVQKKSQFVGPELPNFSGSVCRTTIGGSLRKNIENPLICSK